MPGPFLPWIRATTAVGRGCRISSTPIFSSSLRMRAEVRTSCMPSSGWAWISRRIETSSSKMVSTKERISDMEKHSFQMSRAHSQLLITPATSTEVMDTVTIPATSILGMICALI